MQVAADVEDPAPTPRKVFTWEELRTSGVLWALNTYVLFPRGYAIAFEYEDGSDEPIGWSIQGQEGEQWVWKVGSDIKPALVFEKLLSDSPAPYDLTNTTND